MSLFHQVPSALVDKGMTAMSAQLETKTCNWLASVGDMIDGGPHSPILNACVDGNAIRNYWVLMSRLKLPETRCLGILEIRPY